MRRRSRLLVAGLGLLVAAALLAMPALVDAGGGGTTAARDRGLRTGWAHSVRVVQRSTVGLEADIPRDGKYAKAMELDRQGKYRKAYQMYRKASTEFYRMRRSRPFDKRIAGWQAKANQQRSLSYNLNYSRYRYRYGYRRRRYYRSYYSLFNYANNCHQKWLAMRAFGVTPPPKLVKDAVDNYERALKLHARYPIARLQLAGLYVELGRLADARRHFAKTSRPFTYSHWIPVAYYYAVSGAREKALQALGKVVRRSTWKRKHVWKSNFFDSLRGDPRFEALVRK